jgi:hypothetical protein
MWPIGNEDTQPRPRDPKPSQNLNNFHAQSTNHQQHSDNNNNTMMTQQRRFGNDEYLYMYWRWRLGRGRETWDVWQLAPCLHTLGTSGNLVDFRGKMFFYINHVMSYKTPRNFFSISWYYDICKGITKPLPELGGFADDSISHQICAISAPQFPCGQVQSSHLLFIVLKPVLNLVN